MRHNLPVLILLLSELPLVASPLSFTVSGTAPTDGPNYVLDLGQTFSFDLSQSSTFSVQSLWSGSAKTCPSNSPGTTNFYCEGQLTLISYLDNSSVFGSFSTYFEQNENAYRVVNSAETDSYTLFQNCNGQPIHQSTAISPCVVTLSPGHHTLTLRLHDEFDFGLFGAPQPFSDQFTVNLEASTISPEPASLVLLALGLLLAVIGFGRRRHSPHSRNFQIVSRLGL
jgi:hypothetical protein